MWVGVVGRGHCGVDFVVSVWRVVVVSCCWLGWQAWAGWEYVMGAAGVYGKHDNSTV